MLFNVAIQVRFTGDRSGLEKLLDAVMDELVKLEVTDPSIGGTLPDGDVEFRLVVEADTLEKATGSAFGTIRAAIHAAGGGTPGWPEFRGEGVRAQRVHAEPLHRSSLITGLPTRLLSRKVASSS